MARKLSPPPGQRQGRVPSLPKEQREERNRQIMGLFIAGLSQREIGRRVNLTGQRIDQIVKQELKAEARHQSLCTDQALNIYTARLETLLKACWPKVTQGDLKAIETARRVLEQMGRLYDIEEERFGALPPANELMNVDEAHDPRDELSKYRARHARNNVAVGEE